MRTRRSARRSLLELPEACLLAVLRCLAADVDDTASLANAALAHSRLHQAAVAALSSMSVWPFSEEDVHSLLLYLDRHGGHVSSLDLDARLDEESSDTDVTLRQLPTSLVQLSSLELAGLDLQLQPGGGFQGVLRPGLPLKQLQLYQCSVLDGEEGLAAALSLLPGLEHLDYSTHWQCVDSARFPTRVLPQLQMLTYLNLNCRLVEDPSQKQPALQPLRALSRLVDLRLDCSSEHDITADMLSGLPHLTHLDVAPVRELAPGALAGKSMLQHLRVQALEVAGGTAGFAQLLSHMQHMQQLTHLEWGCNPAFKASCPPAAAFAVLTASSKLQVLEFDACVLPAGVWQHVFPAGRQLPHLTSLDFLGVTLPGDSFEDAPAPEGSRLVSCCPGLRDLIMHGVECNAAQLGELQGLLALRTLHVSQATGAKVQAVSLLTQLRELRLLADGPQAELPPGGLLLLHLTRLQQLTRLIYVDTHHNERSFMAAQGPGGEPVWVQIARLHLDHDDPTVAQQANTALAEWEAQEQLLKR